MRTSKVVIIAMALLLFSRCAQIGVLSGGEVDRRPPSVVECVPAQKNLNFKEQSITITFNEHIQVLNAASQIQFSPLIEELPDITVKGKSMVIDLSKTTLLPNTTYRIEFGNSIADLTEKNSLKNFEYVFSTGASIDSLQITGRILAAEDNSPEVGMQVGLYPTNKQSDSLLYKTTPLYIGVTDNTGAFAFRNLPSQTYSVAALGDKNKNKLYDGETERIAFLSSAIALGADSVINLWAFTELSKKTFVSSNTAISYGKHLLKLNKDATWLLKVAIKEQEENVLIENKAGTNDSIFLYYHHLSDTLTLLSGENNLALDTLYLRLPKWRKKSLPAPEVLLSSDPAAGVSDVVLRFSSWMDTLQATKIELKLQKEKDSLEQKINGRWINVHDFRINATILSGIPYTLLLPKGSFSELQGNSCDSLRLSIKTKQASDFGHLKLKIRFKSKQQYIIQLLADQNRVVAQKKVYLSLSGSNLAELDFKGLEPGTYKVKVIYDNNENEKWDTGNYLKKIQAEKVSVLPKEIKILADWEIEEELDEK
jgi:uncharacterized protein (DUF2141 family)